MFLILLIFVIITRKWFKKVIYQINYIKIKKLLFKYERLY